MPVYEYKCPKHGVFELMQVMAQRHDAQCPCCDTWSRLLVSRFNIYNLNWVQRDGEGFTQKVVRLEEYGEMNKELRER